MLQIKVHVDLSRMQRFMELLQKDLSGNGGGGPVRRAFRDWGRIFERFLGDRFEKFSQGGGDWAPLSPKTLAAKQARTSAIARGRKKKKLPSVAAVTGILRRTDLLFTGVETSIGNPAVTQDIPDGIRVDMNKGLTLAYPATAFTSTIGEVASFHQHGGPHLPKREIVVAPDDPTRRKMQARMQDAINELLTM